MMKNHAYHTFEPKYLLDYRVLKVPNDNTLLLTVPNGQERKTSVNDVKPYSITRACRKWLGFILDPVKTKCQNYNY